MNHNQSKIITDLKDLASDLSQSLTAHSTILLGLSLIAENDRVDPQTLGFISSDSSKLRRQSEQLESLLAELKTK